MSNLQVALDSVEQKLANHEARLQEVRDDMKKAKALNDEEALQELGQKEDKLMDLMKELQVEKNWLSNQLGNVTGVDQQLQQLKLVQFMDKVERFMSDSSNTTVDASKVTGDDIDQIDQALNVIRQPLTAVSFGTMKADAKPQYKWLPSAEDSKEQVLEVMNHITKHLLTDGLDASFCLLNINHSSASNFPRAAFSNLPRHYRGRADYLILNSCYQHLADPVTQRRMALVAFEVKKDLSTQEEAIYLAQARLGFFTYGAQSNAALLYVLTDLVKGGVLLWAKQHGQELQVFEEAVSGMKQLYQLVRAALEAAPTVSRHDAASATARSCTHTDTSTLPRPDRDRFRIVGYQHPRQSPGQLLMNIEEKAYSTEDDQDIRAWYPDQDAGDPVVYPSEDLNHMSMFS